MQILIFLALFSFSSAKASCLDGKKLSFPAEALQYYFSSTDEPRVLPLSQKECALSNRSIDLFDHSKKKVGTFLVLKTIRTKFNDIEKAKKAMPSELEAIYTRLEKDEKVNPYKLLNFLFTLNNKESLDFRQDITFAVGKVRDLKNDLVSFSHYRTDQDHWAAKSIDYNDAINFLSMGSDVEFVHLKNDDPYHLPILSDLNSYKDLNNVFKNNFTDIVDFSQLNTPVKEKPVVVFSKVLQYHQGYNTITNLYLAGYRKIYWYHKSFMKWQAKYEYMKRKFYVGWKQALSNSQTESLLIRNKNVKILDLSGPDVFSQIRFKKADAGQVIYYDTEAIEPYLKSGDGTKIDNRRASNGTYNILNAKELFPERSTILIVTFNHYLNEYKVKEIYRRLEKLGHQVFILKTSTGVFLDYLRSRRSSLVNEIYEEKKTSEVFSWRG